MFRAFALDAQKASQVSQSLVDTIPKLEAGPANRDSPLQGSRGVFCRKKVRRDFLEFASCLFSPSCHIRAQVEAGPRRTNAFQPGRQSQLLWRCPMRLLLRLAFWLGVVICYLPAADPQHQAPGTGGAVQSVTEDRSQMPSVSRRLPCDPSRKLSASLRGQPNGRAPRSERVPRIR